MTEHKGCSDTFQLPSEGLKEQRESKMPTCENCDNKWSWKLTIKKSMTLDPAMICPYCGEKQYQTQKSKTKSTVLSIITILFLFLIPFIYDVSGAVLFSFIFVLFMAHFLSIFFG